MSKNYLSGATDADAILVHPADFYLSQKIDLRLDTRVEAIDTAAREVHIAGGETLIVDFARSFRNRERGPLHHPEFTLLEWYRARAPYQTVMEDCLALLAAAAQATGTRQFAFRDRTADPFADAERITVAEAFARHAGIDLLATVTGRAGAPVPSTRCASRITKSNVANLPIFIIRRSRRRRAGYAAWTSPGNLLERPPLSDDRLRSAARRIQLRRRNRERITGWGPPCACGPM